MGGKRTERLASQIIEEISDIIRRKLSDPRLAWVTLTSAEVTADLREAKIVVRTLGAAQRQQEMLTALQHAAGFIRRELGSRLTWRYIPELHFYQDEQVEKVENVLRLISELKQEGSKQNGGTETGA